MNNDVKLGLILKFGGFVAGTVLNVIGDVLLKPYEANIGKSIAENLAKIAEEKKGA